MASALRKLSDADLERIHHMIRRDATSDAEIAAEATRLAGSASLWKNLDAGARAISRYRTGAQYAKWLSKWENQDAELRRAIETQRMRFEYLSSLVSGSDETGLYEASNHLKARLLTIAAGASDEELKAGDIKWIKSLLKEIREAEKMERSALGRKAEDIAADTTLSETEKRRRMREIFMVENPK